MIPRWLQDADDPESSYEGGTSEQRNVLRAVFLSAMEESARYPEWREAYDMGHPFCWLTNLLYFRENVWASDDSFPHEHPYSQLLSPMTL